MICWPAALQVLLLRQQKIIILNTGNKPTDMKAIKPDRRIKRQVW